MFSKKLLKTLVICICSIFVLTTLASASGSCPYGGPPGTWCYICGVDHSTSGSSSSGSSSDSDEDRTTFEDVLRDLRNVVAPGSQPIETFMDWVSDSWSSWTSPPSGSYSSTCDWCGTEHGSSYACQGP